MNFSLYALQNGLKGVGLELAIIERYNFNHVVIKKGAAIISYNPFLPIFYGLFEL